MKTTLIIKTMLFSFCALLFSTNVNAQVVEPEEEEPTEVILTPDNQGDDDSNDIERPVKGPKRCPKRGGVIPEVSVKGNVLYFSENAEGAVVELTFEGDDEVLFEAEVDEDCEVILPLGLSGTYTLRVKIDGNVYVGTLEFEYEFCELPIRRFTL